ncbi:unnamed protein product [Closterium sp. Yama58-4]|nr:unnamed protein product [Closterium sp. Yama58-4]
MCTELSPSRTLLIDCSPGVPFLHFPPRSPFPPFPPPTSSHTPSPGHPSALMGSSPGFPSLRHVLPPSALHSLYLSPLLFPHQFSYPQATPVRHMHRALSLVYPQATGFYYGLIEWLPQFLLLAPLLQKLPNIAVLGTPEQWAFYDRVLKPLVGVELAQINRVDIQPNELILVDQLFMPLYQCCGKPSPAIWRDMRLRALLPPHGLPFFHKHGWQPRGIQPITESQAAAVLRSDWLVVVARRPGSRRVLDKFEELLEEVKKVFGQEKVRTFDGSLPILEARSLFLQARLFIAGHGAALANMVFMPIGATVLEIRPDRYDNACYHFLASACGLRYNLVLGQGDQDSENKVDLGQVTNALVSIRSGLGSSLMGSAGSRSADKSWNILRPKVPSRHSDTKPCGKDSKLRPRRPSLTIPSSDDSFPPRLAPGGGSGGGCAAGYGAGYGGKHGGTSGGAYGGSTLGANGYPGENDDNVRSSDTNLPNPVEFSYEELVAATDGFSAVNVLGEGGYGKVYRGVVREDAPDGSTVERHVAVKQLNDEGRQGFNEWLTEVVFLRRLRHPHLVQFVGYCVDQQQALLVYELMANASLDYHLFDGTRPPLTWQQRVNVALGAAKGLAYLHEGTERQVIFRDLKAANILLDENFNAKLSDFGLAKDGPAGENTHVSTMVVGTYGYTAPEYLQTGHLTAKSDVYAFGVVLLELLCGRRAVDIDRPGDEKNLVFWAKPFLADRRRVGEIVDPRLEGRFSHKGALKLAVAAHCCLQDAKSRPSMADMVQTLTALMEMGEVAGGGGSGRGVEAVGRGGGLADTPAASRTLSGVSGGGANSARAHTGVGVNSAGVGGGDAGTTGNAVGGGDGPSGGAAAAADGGPTAASYDAQSLHCVQVVAVGNK